MATKKSKKTTTSPLDLQAPIDPAPESAMQTKEPVVTVGTVTVEETENKPDPTSIIHQEYGYCENSLTGPQRALLNELIRVRLLMEGK